jgi:hypothetical protein
MGFALMALTLMTTTLAQIAAQTQISSTSVSAAKKSSSHPTQTGLRRIANMQDGAPAFEMLGAIGQSLGRIECIQNGWVDSDEMAARLMGTPKVLAAIQAKNGRLSLEDLGPGTFNCVVVPPTTATGKPKETP